MGVRRSKAFGAHGARTLLSFCVLACLCFSAGEGLRLMPIASPAGGGEARPHASFSNTSLDVSSQYQYATCGMEKRGKTSARRYQTSGGLLMSGGSRQSPPDGARPAADVEPASYSSPLRASRPPGRAPPTA